MDSLIYTKTLYITLQNKLAMLKDYLETPVNELIRKNLSACVNNINSNIKDILTHANDGIDKLTERLELTNNALNEQFIYYLNDFKKHLPKECFIGQKAEDSPRDKFLKTKLADYNSTEKEYEITVLDEVEEIEAALLGYTDQKNAALKKIKNLYNKIKNQISNIFSYYQEKNISDEADNLKNTQEISGKS